MKYSPEKWIDQNNDLFAASVYRRTTLFCHRTIKTEENVLNSRKREGKSPCRTILRKTMKFRKNKKRNG